MANLEEQDPVTQLLRLLQAAADSVDWMSDAEVAAELAAEDRDGREIIEIVAQQLRTAERR